MIAPARDIQSGGGWCPGKLWSLWDIMKKFDGACFGAYSLLVGTRNKWTLQQGHQLYSPPTLAIFREHTATLERVFREVDLTTFADAAAELLVEIDRTERLPNGDHLFSGQNFGSALGHLNTLAEYLGLEMKNRYLLMMNPTRKAFYEQPKLFGDKVFEVFSSANDDIAEAGTCLALERGTACVMHLLRTVEVGLAALAKQLGVHKQNDWGAYLREIGNELKVRMETAGARSADEQFYAEAAAEIDHMRRAWRNPTFHVEKTEVVPFSGTEWRLG
jgi:hypothetical protein